MLHHDWTFCQTVCQLMFLYELSVIISDRKICTHSNVFLHACDLELWISGWSDYCHFVHYDLSPVHDEPWLSLEDFHFDNMAINYIWITSVLTSSSFYEGLPSALSVATCVSCASKFSSVYENALFYIIFFNSFHLL